MTYNQQLIKANNFQFNLRHLLIIGILIISFSISFMIRSQPADYGYELNEFDPFFNFRATEFIVNNGLVAYFDWHDDMSWHPWGRDISATSQTMLHITTASLYSVFGGNSSLYDFTIVFPVVVGSLSAIVVFALVRVIGGTTAGLFAALFYSLSLPIIIRGTIGWFKSEPLGLFYALLGTYLFLSGIKSKNKKIALSKLIGSGIFLGFGLASWGGIQFFIIPLGIFFLSIPFFRKDLNFIIWAIPTFVTSLLLTSIIFERPGINFVFGMGGISLIVSTLFLISCIVIQKISREEKQIRNGLAFLAVVLIISSFILVVNSDSDLIPLPSFRYLNAINPFLTTTNPLVDSVSEHATTQTGQSFFLLSILMIFAGLGIWFILQKKTRQSIQNDMIVFALIIGLSGVYISSAFIRLEVYASISVIILSSLGLSILTKEIFKNKKSNKKKLSPLSNLSIKIIYVIIIITLLITPTILPINGNWITSAKTPPTILNGGTQFNVATNDWPASLEWIKTNTPKDSVIAAWWDYGYWITTLGERKTLADNATIHTNRIQEIAKMFIATPNDAWESLQKLDADYVLVYVAAQRINANFDSTLYLLNGGGDESKKQWFMRIAEQPLSKFLYSDGISGTNNFWQNTTLGQMIPFSVISYVNLETNEQSSSFQPGFTPIYIQNIKFFLDDNGPFRLAYASPSLYQENIDVVSGIIIYEINKNYQS